MLFRTKAQESLWSLSKCSACEFFIPQGACLRALNAECWDRWSEFKNCSIDFQMKKYIESKWLISLSSHGADTLHINLVMSNHQVLKHSDREGRDCFKGLKARDKITNNKYYCFTFSESFMNYLISGFLRSILFSYFYRSGSRHLSTMVSICFRTALFIRLQEPPWKSSQRSRSSQRSDWEGL